MYYFVSILILIICVILTLAVLIQNSKGGGLSSNFASSNQIVGVQKTTDFLEKATWTLAGALLLLSIVVGHLTPDKEQATSVITEEVTTTIPSAGQLFEELPNILQEGSEDESKE